jgi:hypothetical protein
MCGDFYSKLVLSEGDLQVYLTLEVMHDVGIEVLIEGCNAGLYN